MNYVGAVGLHEVMEFYAIATKEEIASFRCLLDEGKIVEAWCLVQEVTGLICPPM